MTHRVMDTARILRVVFHKIDLPLEFRHVRPVIVTLAESDIFAAGLGEEYRFISVFMLRI